MFVKRNRLRNLQLESLESRWALSTNPIAASVIHSTESFGGSVQQLSVQVEDAAENCTAHGPSATGLTALSFDKSGNQYRLSLETAFTDPDDAVSDLAFALHATSGDPIIQSLSIDNTTGELVLIFDASVEGMSEVTISAEDPGGNHSLTTFGLDFSTPSSPPVLDSFIATLDGDGHWTFSGHVDSSGQDTDDWTVHLGGDLDGTTTSVDDDGNFQVTLTMIPSDDTTGVVTAQVQNGDGEFSDTLSASWYE